MADVTVIYYTSNRERQPFEARIIRTLVEHADGLPIVSVSQFPINLGTNICVGNVGASSVNIYRQMRIGAQAATTPFVCPAESDFLYPREYFTHLPADLHTFDFVRRTYMVYDAQFFYSRRINEAAMVVGRDYLVQAIDDMLAHSGHADAWGPEFPLPCLFENKNRRTVKIPTPMITFKTPQNLHQKHHKRSYLKQFEVETLPFWGTARELTERYCAV
jgi:hypothetical protein